MQESTGGLAYILLQGIPFKHNCFPSTAEIGICYSWEMDRGIHLGLTEQEAAIKELFEASRWDYGHEISLPFLKFVVVFLARNSFVQPFLLLTITL